MSYDLRRTVTNLLQQIDIDAEQIMDDFKLFTDDCRMMILLERTKDGGHNKEEHRTFASRISYNSDQFKENLKELLLLFAVSEKPLRIYLSLNPRNLYKIKRYIKYALLDAEFADPIQSSMTWKKLLRSPRHFVMQPECRDGSLFLVDVDDEDGKDLMGDALVEMERLQIKEVMRYPTKNGWHVVVEPFNLSLWKGPGSVKKDSMLLLKY